MVLQSQNPISNVSRPGRFQSDRFSRLAPQADPQPSLYRSTSGKLKIGSKLLYSSVVPSTHKPCSASLNKFHKLLIKYNFKKYLAIASYTIVTFYWVSLYSEEVTHNRDTVPECNILLW